MTNEQTAVQWLASELSGHLSPSHGPELLGILNKALAMEKEQIVDAYVEGVSDEGRKTIHTRTNAGQYYEETLNASKGDEVR